MSSLFKVDNIKNEAILQDFLNVWTDNVKNEAILRDLFIFQSWQHKKRSKSARLPQFLHLTTSKSKQFCETSLKNWKFSAALIVHLSKVLRLPRKSDARSYEVLHLSRKIILANLQIWCSKMQHLAGNQRPDLLASPWTRLLYCACYGKCIFADPLQMSHACHRFWKCDKSLTFCSLYHAKRALNVQKCFWPPIFCTFDFEMCFAAQRRALFRHRNFQKWSEPDVFCPFWLRNFLRATSVCTFSTSHLPKVVRQWCVLYILTWKCASRHNGVQFFISHLASWLRTRRFSEPTFRPSGATKDWKNTVFRDFPTFSRICIFFLLTLSLLLFSLIFLFSLPLPGSAFHLSILSEVWLLSFLR